MSTNIRCVLISVPANNEPGPQYMDQALAAIHQANARRRGIDLGIRRDEGEVCLGCRFPDDLRGTIESQFFA